MSYTTYFIAWAFGYWAGKNGTPLWYIIPTLFTMYAIDKIIKAIYNKFIKSKSVKYQ